MSQEGWRTIGHSYAYRNPWCAFRLDEVMLPSGEVIEYGVLEGREFVSVVALTEEGNVVLARQWRQPLGRFTLELPSGLVDAGEKPEATAGRELLEETGFRAEGLEHLVSTHTSVGRTDEVCHLFCCRAACGGEEPELEPTEFIEVVQVPFEEALRMALDGKVAGSASVLGLALAAGYGG